MNPFFKVLLSLEACACLIFPRAADADGTNRIGVLTVSYVMTSDGSGEWYWYSPGIYGFSGDDSIQLSIAGKVQYAVMQSETNLFIGEVISATQQQSAAGSYATQSWDQPPTTDGTDTFTSDPSFMRHLDQHHGRHQPLSGRVREGLFWRHPGRRVLHMGQSLAT
jgi:hypothetical protein